MLSTSLRVACFAVFGLLIAAPGSQAGGMKDSGPVYSAPAMWTGFYAGAHAGIGSADWSGAHESNDAPGFVSRADSLDLDGLLGGLQAGYNHQSGHWLFGVEGDVSWSDWSDKVVDTADADDFITGDVERLASLRGRAGIAQNGLLLYGTLGAAVAEATYTAVDEDSSTSGSVDFDDVALVFGAGAEAQIHANKTVRLEVLFYDFDERHDTRNLTLDSAAGDFAKFEDALVVRAGINILLFR